ncbi:hypothetical protein FA95DRAFT_1560215, partial [Auriscalpium vulgare]
MLPVSTPLQSTPPRGIPLASDASVHSTPPQIRNADVEPFATGKDEAKVTHRRLAVEMGSRFIGPMPVSSFFDEFVPPPKDANGKPVKKPTSRKFPQKASSSEASFIAEIEKRKLCPNLQFLDTHTTSDPLHPKELKPDISVVAPGQDPAWRKMELVIERKPRAHDPFADPSPVKDGEDNRKNSFLHNSDNALANRGQISSYAAAQFQAQFREWAFSVVLLDDYARILRWDRAGTVVTERFNWREDPDTLAEFLWRFNHLDKKQRGYDVTVTPATSGEGMLAMEGFAAARKKGKKYLPILTEDIVLHKFMVYDEKTSTERFFVGPSAHVYNRSMAGRGTFGYYAWDIDGGRVVYLKDSWRINTEDMAKETDIYEKLEKAGVQRVAKLGCGGDLPGQSTRSQDFITEEQPWACMTSNVYRHTHCRMSFLTIGAPLQRFSSTRQLCVAIYDALTAHAEAYTKAKILHRDVSAGNILIDEDGRGVLIDWDLSRDISLPPGRRRQWRTGTWQFISAALLLDPQAKPHTVSDDLESFCHVLTYMIVKYRPTKYRNLHRKIKHVYDDYVDEGNVITGGEGKINFFSGGALDAGGLFGMIPKPCFDIIQGLRQLFAPLYAWDTAESAVPPSSSEVMKLFKTHMQASTHVDWLSHKDPAVYVAEAYPPDTDAATNANGKRSRGRDDIGPLSNHPSTRVSALLQSTPEEVLD